MNPISVGGQTKFPIVDKKGNRTGKYMVVYKTDSRGNITKSATFDEP